MKYEYEREDASATTKLTYLLIGGGIGAVIALLFAPKSGVELRGDIADATRKGLEKSKEAAGQLQERAGEYYEVTRDKAGELYGTAQDKASELYQTAQDKAGELAEKAKGAVSQSNNPISAALDAGKQAYRDEKRRTENSAITEGRPAYPVEKKELPHAPNEKGSEK
ncbi:MAG: YtxH domain-containing protein [Pyrinomonadaceae bacterium]